MMDHTVPMIGLAMRLGALDRLPEYALPDRYDWRFFQPGDEAHWAEIEISAGEFSNAEKAIRGFRKYFPTDDGLDARRLFLTDEGTPFATATAWFVEGDDIILLDYKTDHVRSADELVKRYKIQLDLYKRALEAATGKKVKEIYIYSFSLGQEVALGRG